MTALALFFLFLAASLGYGSWLSQRLAPGRLGVERTVLSAALGTAFLSLLIELQGLAQALGPGLRALNWAALAAGAALLFRKELRLPRPHLSSPWAAVPVYLVLLRFLEGFRLHSHGDPFYYHLAAPATFVFRGGIGRSLDFPQSLQASTWEDLYLWGAQTLLGANGEGLAGLQCFGQWTHSILGYGGAGLALWALLRRAAPDPRLRSLAVLAALSTAGLDWSSHLAKNDWGAAFWILAGLVAAREGAGSPRELAAAALLCGMGGLAKPIYGLAVLGWVVAHPALVPRTGARWLAAAAGFAVGMLPVAARNFFLTGNPLFPWADSIFRSGLVGPSLRAGFEAVGPSPLKGGEFLPALRQRLGEWAHSSPFVWLAPVSLFLPSLEARRFSARASLALLLALTAFAAFIPRPIEFRYLGPALLLFSATGALAFEPLLRLPRAGWLLAVPACWALAFSVPPHHVFLQLLPPRWKPLAQQTRGHTNGELKAWIRENTSPRETLVTSGDNEIYHLLPRRVLVTSLSRPLDERIRDSRTPEEAFTAIAATGARYFVWSEAIHDLRPVVRAAAGLHPEAIVFRVDGGWILDLTKLSRPR